MTRCASPGNGSHNKLSSTYIGGDKLTGSVQSLELLSSKGKITEKQVIPSQEVLLEQTHVKQTRNVGFG